MKRVKQLSRDVYDTTPPEEQSGDEVAGLPLELLEAAVRRWRRQMIILGSLLIALFFVLGEMLGRRSQTRKPAPEVQLTPDETRTFIPYHTLPSEALWVINYEHEATDLDLAATNQAFSIEWVKHAAYHLITAQQALKTEQSKPAVLHLEKAITAIPELRGIHGLIGTLCLQQGDLDEAVHHLEEALKEGETYAGHNNLGSALMATGELERAEKHLLKARELNPDHPASHKNLALLYQEKGMAEQALASYESYFSRYDQDVDAMVRYAKYLIALNRREDAVTFLKSGCESHSGNALPLCLLLAEIEAHQENEQAAVDALEKITRHISPNLALTELNRPEFDTIRDSEVFRQLVHRMELAVVRMEEPQ